MDDPDHLQKKMSELAAGWLRRVDASVPATTGAFVALYDFETGMMAYAGSIDRELLASQLVRLAERLLQQVREN